MSISLIHSGTVLDVVQECLSGQDCDACAYGHEFTELFVVRIDAESQIYLLQVRQEVWKCWGIQESYENSRPERTRIYIAFPLPKTSSQKATKELTNHPKDSFSQYFFTYIFLEQNMPKKVLSAYIS